MEYLLGIIVSLVVEAVKKVGKTDTFTTHLVLLVASVAGAAAYVYLRGSDLWPAIVSVLLVASTFHNLVIRKFY